MEKADIGHSIRTARERAGLSQEAVGEALGIPRTAVTQLEAGRRSVSSTELADFARLVGRSPSAILQAEPATADMVSLLRVIRGLEDAPVVKAEIDRTIALFEEGAGLSRLLGHDDRHNPPSYSVGPPRTIGDAINDGEEIAAQERRRLDLGGAAIPDMSDLISEQGVWATATELTDEMSGLFLRHDTFGLAIIVNAGHARARKRFSYAHEYGHALMDRDGPITVSSTDNSSDLVEKRANVFAAAFLMPAEGVAEVLDLLSKGRPSRSAQSLFDAASGQRVELEVRHSARQQRIAYSDAARLARYFGVSYQAACYRLRSLRYLSNDELASLLDQQDAARAYISAIDGMDSLDTLEPEPRRDRSLRQELLHLGLEAYRRGEISRGRLLEMRGSLKVSGEVLASLAEAAREAD